MRQPKDNIEEGRLATGRKCFLTAWTLRVDVIYGAASFMSATSIDARHQGSRQQYRCRRPCSLSALERVALGDTHINHCNVENLTASTRSRRPATSCSILASVSLMRISCVFASSRILPFSRLRSSLTLACVRPISSRILALSLARSPASLSWLDRVSCASVLSALESSLRSLAKSTLCVYVLRSASSLRTMVRVRFCIDSSITSFSTRIMATDCSSENPSPFSL